MTPLKIECPDCGASLKISDSALAGKKVKCPKCRGSVPVPAQDDDGFLSDFDSNQYEDLPYEPDPEPRKAPKARKKKPRPRPARRPGDNKLARAGGVAVALVVCLLIGLKFARPFLNIGNAFGLLGGGVSGIGPDLTWLPDRLDAVGEFRVSQIVQTPAVTQALQRPDAIAGIAMMTGMLGFNLHDVDAVRFGAFSSPVPMAEPRFAGVVKLLKPGRVAAVLEGASGSMPPGATKVAHGSRMLYTLTAMPTVALCCVDEQTILFGGMNELKAVLDKDGKPESTSRFAFLDKAHQSSVVVAPSNPTANGYLGDGNLDVFSKTPMEGISFCFDLDSMLHGSVLVNAKSSKAAQDTKLQFDRDLQSFVRSPTIALMANPELQKALLAAKTTVSGRLVSLTADIPTNLVVDAIAQSPGFGAPSPAALSPPSFQSGQSSLPQPTAIAPPVTVAEPAPVRPGPAVAPPYVAPVSPPSAPAFRGSTPPRPGMPSASPPPPRPSAF
jgi:predicted Zn finger-like uncharacterized protein